MAKQKPKRKPDYILLSIIGFLLLSGIIVLTSVSTAYSQQNFGSPVFYLSRHAIFILLGGVLAFTAYKMPLNYIKKKSPIFFLISLFLALMVFMPKIGVATGGASRWINLGFTTFQPSELLKIAVILYLAFWLSKREAKLISTLVAFFVIIGLVILVLILQRDLSTLVVIMFCALAMYFLSGTSFKHNLLIILTGLTALAALIISEPYRLERFLVFIKQNVDPMGTGYQLEQALITIGSGGIFGKAPGMSVQKFFLPQPMADSIFATFAEEWGFIGSIFLITLFLIFAWQGIALVKKSRDKFYQLTALGITCWITLQAFVNMGSMVGILPLTGIPLPFISYGGSALIAEFIGLGILLNISKNT